MQPLPVIGVVCDLRYLSRCSRCFGHSDSSGPFGSSSGCLSVFVLGSKTWETGRGSGGVIGEGMASGSVDERVKELGPIIEGKDEEKGAHLIPQAAHGMVFF